MGYLKLDEIGKPVSALRSWKPLKKADQWCSPSPHWRPQSFLESYWCECRFKGWRSWGLASIFGGNRKIWTCSNGINFPFADVWFIPTPLVLAGTPHIQGGYCLLVCWYKCQCLWKYPDMPEDVFWHLRVFLNILKATTKINHNTPLLTFFVHLLSHPVVLMPFGIFIQSLTKFSLALMQSW